MEGVIKPGGNVLNAERTSTSTAMLKDNKGKKNKPSAKGPRVRPTSKIGKSMGKGKGNCFQCGELGHWKRNCPDFLAMKVQGMSES